MAKVFPFSALRYDPRRAPLASVVTQPYDKISPAMQARYYEQDPHNLVRIILGRAEPGDSAERNVYTRAAESLREWRRDGVLAQDREPSIYRYTQRFTVPGASETHERAGFIALGQLEDYDRGVVFRHEQTLTGPKQDRLNLLRTTRAHFGQLFMLYGDPERRIDRLLARDTAPDIDVTDEYGVQHRVWRVSEPPTIAAVTAAMADKKLIIADGHHRYETALGYRNERRQHAAAAGAGSATRPAEQAGDAPYERVMMTFVNMDAPGLVILPGHRVVHSLPKFESGTFVLGTRQHFTFEQLPGKPGAAELTEWLAENRRGGNAGLSVAERYAAVETGHAPPPEKQSAGGRPPSPGAPHNIVMIAVTKHGTWTMRYLPGTADHLLEGVSERQRQLDVVILHRVVLQTMLGISEADIRSQKHVHYYRDAHEAIESVRSGRADVAFLMNPVTVQQTRDIALAGEVMPQKATDFYPKMLSGLTIYALE